MGHIEVARSTDECADASADAAEGDVDGPATRVREAQRIGVRIRKPMQTRGL